MVQVPINAAPNASSADLSETSDRFRCLDTLATAARDLRGAESLDGARGSLDQPATQNRVLRAANLFGEVCWEGGVGTRERRDHGMPRRRRVTS